MLGSHALTAMAGAVWLIFMFTSAQQGGFRTWACQGWHSVGAPAGCRSSWPGCPAARRTQTRCSGLRRAGAQSARQPRCSARSLHLHALAGANAGVDAVL
jgi:hypothetical protein